MEHTANTAQEGQSVGVFRDQHTNAVDKVGPVLEHHKGWTALASCRPVESFVKAPQPEAGQEQTLAVVVGIGSDSSCGPEKNSGLASKAAAVPSPERAETPVARNSANGFFQQVHGPGQVFRKLPSARR